MRRDLGDQIRSATALAGLNNDLPVHLQASVIEDYLAYASDSAQVIPLGLLLIIGLGASFALEVNGVVALGLGVVLLTILFAHFRLRRRDPAQYARRRRLGLGYVNGSIAVCNVAVLILLAIAYCVRPGLFS